MLSIDELYGLPFIQPINILILEYAGLIRIGKASFQYVLYL